MEPEERKMLERAVALSEENNHMLRRMRLSNRLGLIWKIIYWVAIIALSYGAYVYLQPYVDQLTKMYSEIRTTADNVSKASSKLPRF